MMRSMRLFSPADYTVTAAREETHSIMNERANERVQQQQKLKTHIVYVFVDGEASQLWRLFREAAEDPGRRQVFAGGRNLPGERQALQIPTDVPERPGSVKLLLHGDEAHVEAQRDGLRLRLRHPPLEALEYIRRDAQIRTPHHKRRRRRRPIIIITITTTTTLTTTLTIQAASRSETHLPARIAVVLERDELRLRREPPREGLPPREHAIEALELERTIVKNAHVVPIHGPFPRASAPTRLGDIDGRRDAEVLQVHQKLHHPRDHVRVPRLGLPVHGAGERETLHTAGKVGPREHGAAKIEQPLFGDGDVFIELDFCVRAEGAGYEA